ncbi:hypothetical protein AOLI_G00226160 [Acnodon oligacanthus]
MGAGASPCCLSIVSQRKPWQAGALDVSLAPREGRRAAGESRVDAWSCLIRSQLSSGSHQLRPSITPPIISCF